MPEFVARLEVMQRHLVERGVIDDGEAFRELMAWGATHKIKRGFIEDWPPECIPAAYQHLRQWAGQRVRRELLPLRNSARESVSAHRADDTI